MGRACIRRRDCASRRSRSAPTGGRSGASWTRALAVDIDPIAIEATEANARHNRVGRRIRAREGTIPTDEGPFETVLANLIAGILIELAPHLADEVTPGGTLIASGIFIDREAATWAALDQAGFGLVGRWAESDWVALEAVRES